MYGCQPRVNDCTLNVGIEWVKTVDKQVNRFDTELICFMSCVNGTPLHRLPYTIHLSDFGWVALLF
jgi:hypothetical protein